MINKTKIQRKQLSKIVIVLFAASVLMSRFVPDKPGYDFISGLLDGLTIPLAIWYIILLTQIKKERKDFSIGQE